MMPEWWLTQKRNGGSLRPDRWLKTTRIIQPTIKQSVFGAVIITSFTIMSRYIISGMSEVNCLLSVLLLCSGIFALSRSDTFAIGWWIYSNILLTICTLMRGYYVVFGIFLVHLLWKKEKKTFALIQIIMLFGNVALYLWSSAKLCAPYFAPLINTDWVKLFFVDFIEGIENFISISRSGFYELGNLLYECIKNGNSIGGCYAIFWLLGIYFLYRCLKRDEIFKIWLLIWVIIQLAIIYFYDIGVGSRHVLVFAYTGMLYIAYKEHSKLIFSIIVWMIIVSNRGLYEDTYYWNLPIYNEEVNTEIVSGREQMNKSMIISEESRWDNTLYYPVRDESVIDWRMLYAIPAGIGIEWGNRDDVLNNYSNLMSKYVITNIGEELDKFFEDKKRFL